MSLEKINDDSFGGSPNSESAVGVLDIWEYGLELQSQLQLHDSDLPGFTRYMEQGGANASLVALELLPESELAQAA